MYSANREFKLLRQKTIIKEKSISVNSNDDQHLMMDKYIDLYRQNEDFVGWLKIEGTNIDYPVMYTPKEPEYYLRKSFSKEYSYSGTPFVGKGCSLYPRTKNVIIYGHNMLNKTMFTDLIKYKDEPFYNLHPVIQFDTLYQSDLYEIIAVFTTSIELKEIGQFKFYEPIILNNSEEFEVWKNSILAASLYRIDKEFGFADEFITLSTCSYHTENGRFVVMARKVTPS